MKFDCLWLRYILLNNPETVKCYPKNDFFMSSWDAKPCKFTGFAGSRADAAGCSSYLTPVLGTPVPNFHRSMSWKSTKLTLHDYKLSLSQFLVGFRIHPTIIHCHENQPVYLIAMSPRYVFRSPSLIRTQPVNECIGKKIPSRSSIFNLLPHEIPVHIQSMINNIFRMGAN